MADFTKVLIPVVSEIKPVPANGTEYLHAIVPAGKYKVAILNEAGEEVAAFPLVTATSKTDKNFLIQVRVRINDSFDKSSFSTERE